jgi:UDP-4-amino-4-deoxy-L-arabinose-oxoglutarate aminotransferase
MMKVEFYRHNLADEELISLQDTFRSTFLTAGPKTKEFEKKFAEYLGIQQAIGLTSCTAGLFLGLKALGIGKGDEVLVPAMTFVASANVVLHCGAKPVLVDVEADTGLMDITSAERAVTARTKGAIPVHLYGQMVDMKALRHLAHKHSFALIEDAAHCIEGQRDGYRPGSLGDAAAFSFYATKNITCGEGGALVTNDFKLGEHVRLLRQHGMSKSAADRYHSPYLHWDMLELGYKYNMFDIQAALLLPQLATMEKRLTRREQICAYYESEFRRAGVEFPVVRDGARSARHMFIVWGPPGRRDLMLKELQARQIGVAVHYRPIHLLTYYREQFGYRPGIFPNAEGMGDRTLTIPLYPSLTDAEVEYVAKSVVDVHSEVAHLEFSPSYPFLTPADGGLDATR